MKIGIVARWKPLHVAHAALLESLASLAASDVLLVGLGSSNRYDARNPFTAEESAAMVEAVLRPRGAAFRLLPVPDLGDGPRWAAMVRHAFGPLDLFVSANDYVRSLLLGVYPLAHPRDVVPRALHAPVDGTRVRLALARGERWEHLVPPPVAEVLRRDGLVERFRREFGLATLAALDACAEPAHVGRRDG